MLELFYFANANNPFISFVTKSGTGTALNQSKVRKLSQAGQAGTKLPVFPFFDSQN
jgi:hypothetical protein